MRQRLDAKCKKKIIIPITFITVIIRNWSFTATHANLEQK